MGEQWVFADGGCLYNGQGYGIAGCDVGLGPSLCCEFVWVNHFMLFSRYRTHWGTNDARNRIQVPLPHGLQTNNRAHMCGPIDILEVMCAPLLCVLQCLSIYILYYTDLEKPLYIRSCSLITVRAHFYQCHG